MKGYHVHIYEIWDKWEANIEATNRTEAKKEALRRLSCGELKRVEIKEKDRIIAYVVMQG